MTTDMEVVRSLGLEKGDGVPDGPYFGGWFCADQNAYSAGREPDPRCGYVGMLINWFAGPRPKRAAYVCLPGFHSGVISEGECAKIGEERLHEAPTVKDMGEMLSKGLVMLKELTAAEADAHS